MPKDIFVPKHCDTFTVVRLGEKTVTIKWDTGHTVQLSRAQFEIMLDNYKAVS